MDKTGLKKLGIIQQEIKAPKNQVSPDGSFKYRNLEDILEASKPVLAKNNVVLFMQDDIVQLGSRYYVKASACLVDGETGNILIENHAFAREGEDRSMGSSQNTGSASSYARKYALSGLFLLDDAKDPDALPKRDPEETTETSEEPKQVDLADIPKATTEEAEPVVKEVAETQETKPTENKQEVQIPPVPRPLQPAVKTANPAPKTDGMTLNEAYQVVVPFTKGRNAGKTLLQIVQEGDYDSIRWIAQEYRGTHQIKQAAVLIWEQIKGVAEQQTAETAEKSA